MPGFFTMSEQEMILLSAAAALLIIENLDADEQNTLGNFLMAVGQNISSGVFQTELREKIREQIKEKENNKSENNKIKDGNGQ